MAVEITMLGTSGTGKTCYLYAMASRMATGVNSLTFLATNYEDGLELQEEWSKICEEGVTPDPTGAKGSREYQFTCSYSYRPFADFKWFDYKGGVLTKAGDELDKECRDMVRNRAKTSGGIIICISAELLHDALSGKMQAQGAFLAYASLLQEVRRTGKTVPVMFAITKADLLTAHEYEEGVRHLREGVFASLFAPNGGWFVGFVPVSLGRDITIKGCKIVGGTINPWNVEIPVLFCIKAFLDEQLPIWEDEIKRRREDRSAASARLSSEQNKSAWSKFWGGDYSDSIKTEIQSKDQQIVEATKALEQLQQDVDSIATTISASGAMIFVNGQKVS